MNVPPKLAFISGIFFINKNKKYHLVVYLLFTLLVVILTNERMSAIMFVFAFFIYLPVTTLQDEIKNESEDDDAHKDRGSRWPPLLSICDWIIIEQL